jgi:hypothetical protein
MSLEKMHHQYHVPVDVVILVYMSACTGPLGSWLSLTYLGPWNMPLMSSCAIFVQTNKRDVLTKGTNARNARMVSLRLE